MNRFKIIPIFFFMIQALLSANTLALNAPYLTSATPTNGHSIALLWRNNDFAATRVLILRKTAVSAWVLKDSVAGTVTSYTDSSLQPLTAYSFALLASAPGLLSDTSNVLSATTLKVSEVFAVPAIAVTWIEGRKFIGIRFFDSSTTEKGFRLFKKSLTDSWASIDSMVTQAPDTAAWKSFTDSAITDNKWYSYKIQVYNDSQTAFSPETTVYNYVLPAKTKSYVMTKRGSIPAKPISWVERIGDSLYFPELAAPGDTEISVVDVSNNSSPQFRGYVDPKNIPVWLRGSIVEARVKIPNEIFAHRNGYYIVSRDSTIYQYDSASLAIRDSIMVVTPFFVRFKQYSHWLVGWLNDTCCLVGVSIFNGDRDNYYAWPVHFGVGGLDTFSITGLPTQTSYSSQHIASAWGCYNNKAVFYSESHFSVGIWKTYIVLDFSRTNEPPVQYYEDVPEYLFGNVQSQVIDTSVVFISSTWVWGVAVFAFNIADAHSGPDASYLGKLADSSNHGGTAKQIMVNSAKKHIYFIGDSGIFIYSYSIGPAGVRHPIVSRNSPMKRLSISQNSRGVCFSIIGAKMQSLQVLNSKGQIIQSANIPAGETFVWNRRDNYGAAVPVGFYIYKVGTVKDGAIAGSMVLVR